MNTSVDFFSAPSLPAHVTNAKSKAMQSMSGGITGGFGNRISLKGVQFTFIQNGSEVGTTPGRALDTVIFAMSGTVQRLYYMGAYNPASKDKPTCISYDGKVPHDDSTTKQSATCATCKQNVKGSGRLPNTKACAYKKRVILLSPADFEGPMYALDVGGMSLFGEQDPSKNLFSFKGYYEKLVTHDMNIAAIVTRLTFDGAQSVPKLHFSPIRALTAEEFAQVEVRMKDPEIERMLADMDNAVEEPAGPAAAPEAQQPVPTPPASAPRIPAPVAQPAPTPPANGGFPTKQTAAPAPVAQQQVPPVANAIPQTPKVLDLDIDSLVKFDDQP